jgi:hypothetical protein
MAESRAFDKAQIRASIRLYHETLERNYLKEVELTQRYDILPIKIGRIEALLEKVIKKISLILYDERENMEGDIESEFPCDPSIQYSEAMEREETAREEMEQKMMKGEDKQQPASDTSEFDEEIRGLYEMVEEIDDHDTLEQDSGEESAVEEDAVVEGVVTEGTDGEDTGEDDGVDVDFEEDDTEEDGAGESDTEEDIAGEDTSSE